jgi:phosphoribosylformylglycinamidine cyclo-ligase
VIENMLPMPEVFDFVEAQSGMDKATMLSTFNCGVGMAIYTHTKEEADKVVALAAGLDLKACVAGHVEASEARSVEVKPLSVTLKGEGFALGK